MTVKELISILNTLPSDAIVIYDFDRCIVDEVIYDDDDNTVTFSGLDEFDAHTPDYFPDFVDESNYDPYMGCDVYDTIDLDEWSDY